MLLNIYASNPRLMFILLQKLLIIVGEVNDNIY